MPILFVGLSPHRLRTVGVIYIEEINRLRAALAAASPAKLRAILPKDTPQSADLIFALDRGIRSRMRPYLFIDENMIFVDPISPTVFLSAYFEGDAGHKPAMAALFNLEATEPEVADSGTSDKNAAESDQ